jgi:hypothetical protein
MVEVRDRGGHEGLKIVTWQFAKRDECVDIRMLHAMFDVG